MADAMDIGTTGARARAAQILPRLDEVEEFPWNGRIAKAQGVYGFDSRDIRSRPFNLLRSRLFKFQRVRNWRLFGVVSAGPGVGKSFVASNLAAALSRTPDMTTYLLDLDLRRGSVAENFACQSEIGVRSFLEGEVDTLAGAARRPEGEKLVLLPTDSLPTHSAELLAGERMTRLAAEMRSQAGNAIFICDLPPVFANDDAAIVMTLLDAYILLVEDGRTTRKQVRDSISALAPAVCAGVVLNRYHGGIVSDTYGYGYGESGAYDDYYK